MDPDLIQALVGVLEAKDHTTAAHTWRVVLYTRALAEGGGADRDMVKRLTYGAALHDVGKIDIPESILQKPGPLTPEEFEVMKTHAALGYDRLVRMDQTDPVILGLVRHHHERFDGKGYPDGLKGDAIPMAARYFAVIDSFDAMTSVRPYRAAVGAEAARDALLQLEAGIATKYCPGTVERFAGLYRAGSLDWIVDYFNDTCPVPEYAAIGQTDQVVERVLKR